MFPKKRQKGEEPIKFYRMINGDTMQLPLVRRCQVCIIIYYSLLFLTQTIMFLYKLEWLYFAQYSCTYFFSLIFQMLAYIVLLPIGAHTVQSFMEEVRWWKIDSAGEAVEKMIKRESFQSIIIMLINAFFVVVASTARAIPQNVDRNVFYEIALLEDIFPKWAPGLTTIHRIQALFVRFLSMVASFGQFLYPFYNSRFQFYMLLYFIKNINEKHAIDQWRIEQRLLFCLRNHINLRKAIRTMLKKIEVVSLAYQVLILVWSISLASYVLLFQDDLRQQKFRFVSLSICGLFMLVILFQLGQDTEDNVPKIFETLVSIDWYDWNESNKKIYLMFLVSALKPYRIQFSENFSLNYNMAGQLLQSAASVVLVVYQLNFM
ncbi:hypothetical protein Zmor_013343 [Zophobas morio]|uniref:Odorant receptor n=1 Tax=Zophobas morio TaxID=2755281 RepID=A0AA38IHH8_9CUCU|nr:hypothetical protein Zmor_013343 [Zophobas morio]